MPGPTCRLGTFLCRIGSVDGRWLVTFSGEALHVVAVDGAANYCLGGEGGYGALEWLP